MKDSFEIKQHTALFDFYRVMISLSFKNRKFRQIYYFIVIVGTIVNLLEFANPKPNLVHAISNLLIVMLFPLFFFIVGGLLLVAILFLVRPDFFKATFYLNNWGMVKKTKKAEYSRPWKEFLKWKETTSFFLLFIVENDAHIITKKNLSETDLNDFRHFLGNQIGLF